MPNNYTVTADWPPLACEGCDLIAVDAKGLPGGWSEFGESRFPPRKGGRERTATWCEECTKSRKYLEMSDGRQS